MFHVTHNRAKSLVSNSQDSGVYKLARVPWMHRSSHIDGAIVDVWALEGAYDAVRTPNSYLLPADPPPSDLAACTMGKELATSLSTGWNGVEALEAMPRSEGREQKTPQIVHR